MKPQILKLIMVNLCILLRHIRIQCTWSCLAYYSSLGLVCVLHSLFILQSRLEAQATESYVTISNLQAENADLLQIKESYMKYTRELEQINDDLERGKRLDIVCMYVFSDGSSRMLLHVL